MILFLDDDPARAEVFLRDNDGVYCVETAAECITALEREQWAEVHLDHDLGGKVLVPSESPLSGMEVVRWVLNNPSAALHNTQFYVHSLNWHAAIGMVKCLRAGGFRALYAPWGSRPDPSRDNVVDALCNPGLSAIFCA